jgi:galactokinase/mevalonate kinase-like predicted kinase
MTKTYEVKLMKALHQYTAYAGASAKAARNAVEILRATLIMTDGTADIYVSVDGGANSPLWIVTDGAAVASERFPQEDK